MKKLVQILLLAALAVTARAQVQNLQAGAGVVGDLIKPSGGFNLTTGQVLQVKSGATISGAGAYDFSLGSQFTVPNGASPTTSAFGWLAGKNNAWAASRGALQFYDGTANTYLVGVLTSSSPSNGNTIIWNTGGTITWGSGGGTVSSIATSAGVTGGTITTTGTLSLDLTYSPTWTGIWTFSPAARSSGSASYWTLNMPADTGISTTAESKGINIVGATRTWVDGTTAAQEEYFFGAPTYNKTTTSATFTVAATFSLAGPPVAGSGVTLTTPLAEWIKLGNLGFGASGSIATVGPTGTGGIALQAAGTNQNININPIGTGVASVAYAAPFFVVSDDATHRTWQGLVNAGFYGIFAQTSGATGTEIGGAAYGGGGVTIRGSVAGGTYASPSGAASGTYMQIGLETYGTSTFGATGWMSIVTTEAQTQTAKGCDITFTTTLTGTTTRRQTFTIGNDGSAKSINPTGGVGYGTGAGGAVTQATNRTTGVTLNNVTGAITTNNTSLAALALATFTVTDSAVAIGDVVNVTIRSGTTNTTTLVYVSTVAAGSFNITVDNTNGTTAETGAIIINFAVIKAVSS